MPLPSISEVRDYLSDNAMDNIKFDDEIFTDHQIQTAMNWAEERLSIIGPIDSITSGEVPKYGMLVGIIAQLFRIKWINLTMNRAPSMQENGIAIPIGEDADYFYQMFQLFDRDFVETIKTYKHSVHIKNAMTSIKSPYDRYRKNSHKNNPRLFG
jgi:hypothetical protein